LTNVNIESARHGAHHLAMAAKATMLNSRITVAADHRSVELPERFAVRVLGDSERRVNSKAIKIIGRRLIAQIDESVSAGEPVRIDAPDSLLLGEVLGCWHEPHATFAAIEIQQALTRLSDLAKWMDERERVDVRLSA
jgi:hypothetical protein